MAQVEVRPLETKKWHGKGGKENFSRPKTIEVLYDDETGRYATGLSKEEEQEYSKLMGGVDLSDSFNGEPHPYWSTKPAAINLPYHTVVFNTNRPADYIKVKNLKASKFVANSMTEYNEGKWPFATHVIFDESEEVKLKADKAKIQSNAVVKASTMSGDAKRAMIMVLTNKNLEGRSDDFVDAEIGDICNDSEKATEFLKYVAMGRDEVTLRAQVLKLLQKNILTKDGPAINYLGEPLGYDYESALDWFRDDKNQVLKIAILEKLNKK